MPIIEDEDEVVLEEEEEEEEEEAEEEIMEDDDVEEEEEEQLAEEENERSSYSDQDDDKPLISERSNSTTRKRLHDDDDNNDDSVESITKSSPNSLTVTLTDPDVLDCPICFLPLTIPIYQCDNGHIACSRCCNIMIKNVCPSCSLPIGYNRCRAMEKVLESCKISCTNITYGCKEMISYNKKHEHELMCIHEPCSCPHRGCYLVASSKLLYVHYYSKHLHSAISFDYNSCFIVPAKKGMEYVILQESVDKTLFVLNYGVLSIGNVANITCISPSSVNFSYELVARKGDSNIKLESFTQSTPRWSQHLPCGTFLLVPSEFLDCSGEHHLEVCIQSNGGQGNF